MIDVTTMTNSELLVLEVKIMTELHSRHDPYFPAFATASAKTWIELMQKEGKGLYIENDNTGRGMVIEKGDKFSMRVNWP